MVDDNKEKKPEEIKKEEKKPEEIKKEEKKPEINTIFFGEVAKVEKELAKNEMSVKGANRKFTELYDIHFMIGSEVFGNIIEFLNEMSYDVLFRFRKKELLLYLIDLSLTHGAHVTFEKTEFADYEIKGIEDNTEKVFYIDTTVFDKIEINKEYPFDIYIDSVEKKRFYVINGKQLEWTRLNSSNDVLNPTLKSYANSESKLSDLMKSESFQQVVISHVALKSMMTSLSKKSSKEKEDVLTEIFLKRNELRFLIEDEKHGSDYILNGEDISVYPIKNENICLILSYFKKFNKLRLSFFVKVYVNEELPFIFETKLGSGRIHLIFKVAPKSK